MTVGLNRAEALFRSGHYIEPVKRFPARLGTEAAGVIEAVGEGVTGLRSGQPVSTVPAFSQNDDGVYADEVIVPAAAVLRRPEGLWRTRRRNGPSGCAGRSPSWPPGSVRAPSGP
jgi:NADPH:quinone reductase-like Zn-dependent oxidoreductase